MNNSRMCEEAKRMDNVGEIEKAYQLYLEAAIAEDDGDAMYELARMYFDGDYVHESYDKAGRYFGLAYDRDVDVSPYTLIIAGSYWKKRSGENTGDLQYAMKYFRAAGELGVSFGYECLAEIYYELGQYDKAYEYFTTAGPENFMGLYYLGRMYEEGLYVEKNKDTAVTYYQDAARLDDEYRTRFGEAYESDDYFIKAKVRLEAIG